MPYGKMGSAKTIAKVKYFSPILDAVAKLLLTINSKHPTQKLGFRESLGFVWYARAGVNVKVQRGPNMDPPSALSRSYVSTTTLCGTVVVADFLGPLFLWSEMEFHTIFRWFWLEKWAV